MEQLKKVGYVVLGTGELAAEKVKGMVGKVRDLPKQVDVADAYGDLAKRGERLFSSIVGSKPAERAVKGTRQAGRQLKGAVTSLRKAAGVEQDRPAKKTSSMKAR